jgi:hypothetical protein
LDAHTFKASNFLTNSSTTISDGRVTDDDEHLLALIVFSGMRFENLASVDESRENSDVTHSAIRILELSGLNVGEHAVSIEPLVGIASDVIASADASGDDPRDVGGTIGGDTHAETGSSRIGSHGSIARPRADRFDETDEPRRVATKRFAHFGSTFNDEHEVDGGALNIARILALSVSPDALRESGAAARIGLEAALHNFATSGVAASRGAVVAAGLVHGAHGLSGCGLLVVLCALGGHASGRRDGNRPFAVEVEVALSFSARHTAGVEDADTVGINLALRVLGAELTVHSGDLAGITEADTSLVVPVAPLSVDGVQAVDRRVKGTLDGLALDGRGMIVVATSLISNASVFGGVGVASLRLANTETGVPRAEHTLRRARSLSRLRRAEFFASGGTSLVEAGGVSSALSGAAVLEALRRDAHSSREGPGTDGLGTASVRGQVVSAEVASSSGHNSHTKSHVDIADAVESVGAEVSHDGGDVVVVVVEESHEGGGRGDGGDGRRELSADVHTDDLDTSCDELVVDGGGRGLERSGITNVTGSDDDDSLSTRTSELVLEHGLGLQQSGSESARVGGLEVRLEVHQVSLSFSVVTSEGTARTESGSLSISARVEADETNTHTVGASGVLTSAGASEEELSAEEDVSQSLETASILFEGAIHGRGRVEDVDNIHAVAADRFSHATFALSPGASRDSSAVARSHSIHAHSVTAGAVRSDCAAGLLLADVGGEAVAGTVDAAAEEAINVPLALGGGSRAVGGGGELGAGELTALTRNEGASEFFTVVAFALSGVVGAREFEKNGAGPGGHFGSHVGVHDIIVLADVTLDTINVGHVLPISDCFVHGGDNSDVHLVHGISGGDVSRHEAAPSGVGRSDFGVVGHTAFIHGVANPLGPTLFGTDGPLPGGSLGGDRSVSHEAGPEGHVGLGTDALHFLVRSDGGEVTVQTHGLGFVTVLEGILPGAKEGNEAVEVAGEGVEECATTESPSDTARLEVFFGGVEDDSGDGVNVFGDGSGTDEVQDTSITIIGVIDLEVSLVVEEKLIEASSAADFNGDGGTIGISEVGLRDVGEGMETEFSLHGDCVNRGLRASSGEESCKGSKKEESEFHHFCC